MENRNVSQPSESDFIVVDFPLWPNSILFGRLHEVVTFMSLSKGIGEIPSMATCQAFVAYRTTTIVQYYFDSLSFASLTILTLLSVLAKKSFRKGKMPLVVLEIEIECSSP